LLGDSVKRRQARAAKKPTRPTTAKTPSARWTTRHWLLVLIAAALPFVMGYAIAVFLLFPPPDVAGEGIHVPDLVGRTVDDARRELAALQLTVRETTPLPSETAAQGTILAQSPLAGQQLRAGGGVRLAISSGRPRVIVPDVIGFPVERAAALLTRLGFQVQRVDEPSSGEPGRILALDPPPGEELQLPARVSITVSAADTTQVDTMAWLATARSRPPAARWSGGANGPIFVIVQTVAPIPDVAERDEF
jgi:hypothetical protein